ncbi:MAG: MoaD/ThiS family protein [Pirellulales bacterium]
MPTPSGQITVSVNLSTTLRVYQSEASEEGVCAVTLAADSTVGDLLDLLAVPRDAAKLVFVNHAKRPLDSPLTDGSRVDIFPLIAGG